MTRLLIAFLPNLVASEEVNTFFFKAFTTHLLLSLRKSNDKQRYIDINIRKKNSTELICLANVVIEAEADKMIQVQVYATDVVFIFTEKDSIHVNRLSVNKILLELYKDADLYIRVVV